MLVIFINKNKKLKLQKKNYLKKYIKKEESWKDMY
jgi:hypothetical protein